MTTYNHTAIVNGDSRKNDAAIWNDPLGSLDAAIGNISAYTTRADLASWVSSLATVTGGAVTLANGEQASGATTLTVDSTADFVTGAYVGYLRQDGTYEERQITVASGTTLTVSATGGIIADNTPIYLIPTGVRQAALQANAGNSYTPNIVTESTNRNRGVYNVLNYGADPTGATDSAAAIQAAIDAANFTNGNIYLPAGTYLIESTLNHTTAGQYTKIIGDGIRVTNIRAGGSVTTMLNLSSSSGFHGRKLVEGITFSGNDIATCGIDASYLRYSTIRDCEFIRMATNGYAAKAGNWVGRFINNMINGADGGGNIVSYGLQVVDDASAGGLNNYVVSQNSFTSCKVGMVVTTMPRSLVVHDNTFDACAGPGIWMQRGCRLTVIRDNYFEGCGDSTGVSVEVAAMTFETWYGSIVAHSLYSATPVTALNSLEITGNLFTGVTTGTHMTLSNLVGVHIHDNYLDETYTGLDSFVRLAWQGALYTVTKYVIIDEKDIGDSVAQLVELDADPEDEHAGLQIRWGRYAASSDQSLGGVMLGNPRGWTQTGTAWTTDSISSSVFDGLLPIYQMQRADSTSEYRMDIDLTSESGSLAASQSNWANRYFRIEGFTRGDGGAGGGRIIVLYSTDNGSSYTTLCDQANSSTDTWTSFRNITFYVPADATDLRFRWLGTTDQAFSFTQFRIVDAATPVGMAQMFTRSRQYTVTNRTTDRSFDADSTSTAELADVLGTLILDLQNQGILR